MQGLGCSELVKNTIFNEHTVDPGLLKGLLCKKNVPRVFCATFYLFIYFKISIDLLEVFTAAGCLPENQTKKRTNDLSLRAGALKMQRYS